MRMDYFIHLANFVGFAAILALSLNLVVGYTGLLSFAHAAFYAIGAYTTAILTVRYDFPFFVGFLGGMALAMLFAAALGPILSRFRGDYYALGSLGVTVIATSILMNWESLTNGPLGITGIPRPSFFGHPFITPREYLLFTGVIVALVYGCSALITRSSFGRALQAIREDEDALKVFGYKTNQYKLMIFVLSAGLASIAGTLFASYLLSIDPTSFTMGESVAVLSMIIVGGLANHRGALLGAAVITLLPELLRLIGLPSVHEAQLRQAVYGLLLTLLMLYRPQGWIGKYSL